MKPRSAEGNAAGPAVGCKACAARSRWCHGIAPTSGVANNNDIDVVIGQRADGRGD